MIRCYTLLQVKVFKLPSFKANAGGFLPIKAGQEFNGFYVTDEGWIALTSGGFVNVMKQDDAKNWVTAVIWADEIPIQIDPTHKLGIICTPPENPTFTNEICSQALQDTLLVPQREMKGDTIFVEPTTRDYLQRIQTPSAYKTVVAPHLQWINRIDWRAECVMAGYTNFVEIIGEEVSNGGIFYQIRSLSSRFDYSGKFPGNFSWITHPTLFNKLVCYNKYDGHLSRPGNAGDCYYPIHRHYAKPNLWISAHHVELFPERECGYRLRGASIWGSDMTPLRITAFAKPMVELIYLRRVLLKIIKIKEENFIK
jgi:hypothetical protein